MTTLADLDEHIITQGTHSTSASPSHEPITFNDRLVGHFVVERGKAPEFFPCTAEGVARKHSQA